MSIYEKGGQKRSTLICIKNQGAISTPRSNTLPLLGVTHCPFWVAMWSRCGISEDSQKPGFPREHLPLKRTSRRMLQQSDYSIRTWAKYSVWTIMAFAIMLIFGSGGWTYPDGGNPSGTCESVSIFDLPMMNLTMKHLLLSPRAHLCSRHIFISVSIITVTTLVPPDSQKLLARWVVLGYEPSVLKSRSLIDTNEGRAPFKCQDWFKGMNGNIW